ncbi:efflux RND transporter permease subunit [Halothermothrix orenii]|uniref:Efflux transporter, putative, hydrophobe/amphiphile efflux-3 (HAE3) family n=1 Tax=Halothermothrix orenii (strain H 168 / OCM 544 / DSM 9562) TaxID=373903 RepID=B8CWD3_HALOH|nr:MMPL family transporter [Halothermothrix orenii]ACL69602.1 efflux transporter, putative, hydrophobe/amphiphile efflux-3 (HAE3) family [Halothermothrix orenii H 168]
MRKLVDFTTRYPIPIIVILVLLTVFFGFNALNVTMTTNIKDFFPASDPRVQTYDRVEETFGGAEYIMVALSSDDIFTEETLKKIKEMTRRLEEIDGVASVQSLTSVADIKGNDFGLEISDLIPEIPENEDEMKVLKEKVLSDDMYSGFIVSEDGKAALNIIEVEVDADSVAVAEKVSQVVEEYKGPEKIYITGTPVLNNVLAESMKADLYKLLPLVLFIIALILFLVFRDFKGVILPFSTVVISVIWTLGLMGLLDKQLSPLNAVMPVILISLGNAYGIYILNRHREELGLGKKSLSAVKGAVVSVGTAVLMAGGTTVAGFASNIFSDITLMKDFGIFTSFGVASALLVSLTMIPAVLTLLKEKVSEVKDISRKKVSEKKNNNGVLAKIANFLADTGIEHPVKILTVTLVIILLSIWGLTGLKTDSNFFNFFARDSQPRIAYEMVKDKFTGSESVEIIIEGDLQNPEVLQAMKKFQDALKETGLVGQPTSLVNIIMRTNRAMHEGDENYYSIPDNSNLIAQYLLLLEMNDSSYLSRFTTAEYDKGRIQALVRDTSSQGIEDLMNYIEEYSGKYFAPLGLETTTTGIIVLIDALAEMIISGQIKGLVFSLVAVFVIVLFLLKSWQGSLLSVFLIAIVTLINFGTMGWSGIALDIVTVLISSIGVGVGIDYSIHIYSRYLEEKKKGFSVEEALKTSVRTTGISIIVNAGAVISGFVILTISSFPPFRYFGMLVSLIMLVASSGAMLWIPAMIIFADRFKTKIKLKN